MIVLDAFNRDRYQQDPEQLHVWNAAQRVVSHTARRSPESPPSTTPVDGTTKAA
jgi:hypothetical protein